jgi:hypothetical protein
VREGHVGAAGEFAAGGAVAGCGFAGRGGAGVGEAGAGAGAAEGDFLGGFGWHVWIFLGGLLLGVFGLVGSSGVIVLMEWFDRVGILYWRPVGFAPGEEIGGSTTGRNLRLGSGCCGLFCDLKGFR